MTSIKTVRFTIFLLGTIVVFGQRVCRWNVDRRLQRYDASRLGAWSSGLTWLV